jgi:hypothetical protein
MQCSSCRFWWPSGEATGNEPIREHSIFDQCRRYGLPAQITDLPDHGRHSPSWTTTKRDDWCGDHQYIEQ